MGKDLAEKDGGPVSGMLTTILPGLRDLRTPLATGYMYLTLYWLWFGSLIPSEKDATGVVQRVYGLQGFLGVSAVLTVLTFIAYLVGSVLNFEQVPKFARETILRVPFLRHHIERRYESVIEERVAEKARQLMAGLEENHVSISSELVENDRPLRGYLLVTGHARPVAEYLQGDHGELQHSIFPNRIRDEVPLMAVRLHSFGSPMFDDYNRNRAEAEFRASIAIPATLILGTLPFELGVPVWVSILLVLFAIIVGLSLCYRSMLISKEAESTIIQVMSVDDKLKSPTEDQVDSLIARQKEVDERRFG